MISSQTSARNRRKLLRGTAKTISQDVEGSVWVKYDTQNCAGDGQERQEGTRERAYSYGMWLMGKWSKGPYRRESTPGHGLSYARIFGLRRLVVTGLYNPVT